MGWVNDKGGSAVQKFKDGGKVDNKFQEATKEGIKKLRPIEEKVISIKPYILLMAVQEDV